MAMYAKLSVAPYILLAKTRLGIAGLESSQTMPVPARHTAIGVPIKSMTKKSRTATPKLIYTASFFTRSLTHSAICWKMTRMVTIIATGGAEYSMFIGISMPLRIREPVCMQSCMLVTR